MRLLAVLAASTAMCSVGVPAAFAGPDIVASLGVGAGQMNVDAFSQSAEGFALQGLVSGAYNFTPVLGVQGDILLRSETFGDGDAEYTVNSVDGALHGFYREPGSFLLGGFVQLGQDSFDGGFDVQKIERTLAGVEAQAFFDQVTVYGQLGWQNTREEEFDDEFSGWFVTAEVRYFLTPDFKIEAHAGRSEQSIDVDLIDFQLESVNVGVGAEYKLADLPLSIFAKYDYVTTSPNLQSDLEVESHRVLVGLKFNLGEETLQDRDRNGASLKPVEFGANSSPFMFGGLPPAP